MLGKAAVAMWCDVRVAARQELDDWHAHEHMPERLSIPGFLRGSRWVAADGGEGYFMLYEAENAATVTTGAYLERLNNPTPWSRKLMPEHRHMVRSLCRVEASLGAGIGQCMVTIRVSPEPSAGARLLGWLRAELLPCLPSRRGLVGAHLLCNMAQPQALPTAEQTIRGSDRAADWVILVNGYDPVAVADAIDEAILLRHGAKPGATRGAYSLACLMTPADLHQP